MQRAVLRPGGRRFGSLVVRDRGRLPSHKTFFSRNFSEPVRRLRATQSADRSRPASVLLRVRASRLRPDHADAPPRKLPTSRSLGFCAIIAATIPVRMSPVPPVDIPGLPVVLTQTSPLGCTTSVRFPLSTTITSCSRANCRATPSRSFCTSAVEHPASRAISPGCGVITSNRPFPLNSSVTALECIQPSASSTIGTSPLGHKSSPAVAQFRDFAKSPAQPPARSFLSHEIAVAPPRPLKSYPQGSLVKARSSTRDETQRPLATRTLASQQSTAPLPPAELPFPPSPPTPPSRPILPRRAHAHSSLCLSPLDEGQSTKGSRAQ